MPTTIISGAAISDISGLPAQSHVVYGVNTALWWAFAYTSTQTLQSYSSPDGTTWTARNSLTLAKVHNNVGRNLGVVYANISSHDVVHIVNAYYKTSGGGSGSFTYHVRATLSVTTCTFGTEAQVGGNSTQKSAVAYGPVPGLDSSAKIWDYSPVELAAAAEYAADLSTNADTGSAWTAGFGTAGAVDSAPGNPNSNFFASLGAGNVLWLGGNGSSAGNFSNVRWSKWNGSSWSAAASIFAADLTSDLADDQWAAVARTTSDVHCVRCNGTNAFDHERFNGTSWSAGDSIPTLATQASGGAFLATDGTSVWLFVVGSDANQTINVSQWQSGSGWSAWSTLTTSNNAKTFLSGYQTVTSSNVMLLWTEGSSTFNLIDQLVSVGTAPAVIPPGLGPVVGMTEPLQICAELLSY